MQITRKAAIIGKDGNRIMIDVPEAHLKMQIAYIANCNLDEEICLKEMEKAAPTYSKESIKFQYDSYKETELEDLEYEEEQALELTKKTKELENTASELQSLKNKILKDKEEKEYQSKTTFGYIIFLGIVLLLGSIFQGYFS